MHLSHAGFLRCLLFLCISIRVPVCRAEPAATLDLYLLIGQSNMAGRGKLTEADTVSADRIQKFSSKESWEPAIEPLHFDKPAAAGAGLGMSFARAMADASPQAKIGLIPCAVGGTPLERWVKGGDLYAQALRRAKLAMRDGKLKGILWHQGESDSGDETKAKSYGERLTKMVTDLRADLGAGEVPFVAGELGPFLKAEGKAGKPSFPHLINAGLVTMTQQVKYAAVAESVGLKDKGDRLHFDTPSLREFGKRYAKSMLQLQTKP